MSSPTTGTTSSALSRRRSASSWSYVLIMSMTTRARRGMGRGRVATAPARPRAIWIRSARLRGLGHELARHARRLDGRADEHARGERADRGDARAGPERLVQAVDVLHLTGRVERRAGRDERAERRHADRDAGPADRVVRARGEAALLARRRAERAARQRR